MHIDAVFSCRCLRDKDVHGKNAVIIDVLRATSVIVTALANGAREIIPCLSPADARQVKSAVLAADALLCGERGAQLIPGFDLGNSPREYTRARVTGRTLIATTTNGTRTILAAAPARQVLIGAILNSGAIADYLLDDGSDSLLICAGTDNEVSFDDLLGAGSIIQHLSRQSRDIVLSDSAMAVRDLYRLHRHDLAAALFTAGHAQRLCGLGLAEDIRYCARENLLAVVPLFRDGRITCGQGCA